MYDITIIGAGPAGSTLARYLSPRYKVLLIDKRNLDSSQSFSYSKCCGGLIAPDAQKILAFLGIGIPKDVLTGPQMFSVKTMDFDNDLENDYQRFYINVDREKFDRYLFSFVPENVEKKLSTQYISYKKNLDKTYTVNYRKEKKLNSVKTKILIGADGALSRVRKQTFKKDFTLYGSIQYWFKTKKEFLFYTSIFDSEISDFYSWIIQKDDKIVLGSAIPLKYNVKKKFDKLVKKLKKNKIIYGEVMKKEGTLILRPRKLSEIKLRKDNIFLIGEAAGLISPSSAEGISYGLKSGYKLAKALNKDFANPRYKLIKLKLNIFIKNLKLNIMYNKFLRKIIIKLGILSIGKDV